MRIELHHERGLRLPARARAIHTLAILSVLLTASPVWAQATAPPAAATVEAPAMPSFRSLLTELPSDVRRLPALTNGLWLAGAGGLALGVHPKDQIITEEAVESPGLEALFEAGATLGSGVVQVGGAFGTYFVGRLTHRPGLAIVGADLVRAQIINTAVTQGLKIAVDRQRPDGARFSFPSGHSSSTFATATVLARHFGWRAGVPAYALATYVAGSRLQGNKHYLSDVIFGAGIGIVSGRAATVGRGAHRFALGPMAGPTGVGISFTKVERH
jgi:membrane-associated phospholipid phosphatase